MVASGPGRRPGAANRAQSAPSGAAIGVVVFPNTTVLPLHVGRDGGFFAAQGLRVDITVTPNSEHQITRLLAGEFQVAIGAFDNVVAYQEGQSGVALDRAPDLFAFMGVARMNLQLVVQPDIRSYADLRGRTLAVDKPSNGFVFVLRRMLERGGLRPGEYELVSVGARRWESLLAGEHAGALLTDNYMSGELSGGLKVLDNSVDMLPPYQSAVGTATRSWAQGHRTALVRFIRAYVASMDWVFDPANRAEAARILARHRDGMSDAAAARAVDQLLSPREGLTPKAALSEAALATVLELRRRYGEPRKRLTDPWKYVDLSYYAAAVAGG